MGLVIGSAGQNGSELTGRRKLPVARFVVIALRCNAGLRMLSGFLTMFMAFLLREHPFPGWEDKRDPAARRW